jgi:hypothetical protein
MRSQAETDAMNSSEARMILDASGAPIARTLTDDDIAQQLAGELQEMEARGPMEIGLNPFTAMQLAGLLQLALRHPEISELHRDTAARFLAGVREYFADSPTVLEVLIAGDDPANDRLRNRNPLTAYTPEQIAQLRADIAAGAGHECDEWLTDENVCALCDRRVEPRCELCGEPAGEGGAVCPACAVSR